MSKVALRQDKEPPPVSRHHGWRALFPEYLVCEMKAVKRLPRVPGVPYGYARNTNRGSRRGDSWLMIYLRAHHLGFAGPDLNAHVKS